MKNKRLVLAAAALTLAFALHLRFSGLNACMPRAEAAEAIGLKAGVAENGNGLPSAIRKLAITNSTLVYTDKDSGETYELGNFSLKARDIGGNGREGPGRASFKAEFRAGSFKARGLEVTDIRAEARGGGGLIEADPVSMDVYGARGTGGVRADVTGDTPAYQVWFEVPGLPLGEVLKSLTGKESMKGSVDLSLDTAMHGKGSAALRESLSGEARVFGKDITVFSFDLDKLLSTYRAAERFDLIDIGAFYFAGPLGTAVTKGYDFANVYKEALGGTGKVTKLIVDAGIRNGVAEARDAGFTTERNRVAVKGGVDLGSGKFVDLTVGVLDRKGCAVLKQKISGTFSKPEFGKVSTIRSLAGPLLDVLKRAKKIITFEDCEVFYTGSLEHPEKEEKGLLEKFPGLFR